MKPCVLIPTYNNCTTIKSVINDALAAGYSVVVVNDGSTDSTAEILKEFGSRINVVSYAKNRGKGYAIRQGLKEAYRLGYTHAVTMDSDGQHKVCDVANLIKEAQLHPDAIIVGERELRGVERTAGSSFANHFANFWFTVQTLKRGIDTQSGFRLYPLRHVHNIPVVGNRYEGELELLVKSAWRLIEIRSAKVNAYYPPKEERVSHFRPARDFMRISVLNTILTPLAFIYGYPSMLVRKILRSRTLTLTLLLILTVTMGWLASRVSLSEDITGFLPESEREQYESAKPRAMMMIKGVTDEECGELVSETSGLEHFTENIPYLLTPDDYERMEARLHPDSIRKAMRHSKEVLLSGVGEYAEQYIAADPIGLYLPTLENLRERGRVITFEDTPEKIKAMESAIAELKEASPQAEVILFSPSEVAKTNAACIKRDSIIALTLSLIIIFILLISFYRSAKPLIYIAFSVLFGGLFSLAAIYLIKGTVSAIAVGAGSIILGIAIDYSLHFITHLKFNGSARETVREVTRPLTIGSFTTIAAFISLLFISAESMRDFGLFAALSLIGTLIFVLVFLPYLVSDGKPNPATPRLFHILTSRTIESKGWVIIVTVALTVILGIFSSDVKFDTNMQHLTYMTPEQRESLNAISAYSIDDVPERTAAWNSFWKEHGDEVNRTVKEAAEAEGLDPSMFTPYGKLIESSIVERAMSNLNHDFNYVLWVCAIVVFTFLLLSMRSAEAAVISFLPMTVSWLWILGIMAIAGIEFNIVNIVLATFIFGLGDDYAIFMMDGLMQENTYGSRMLAVDKNAVTLSALTLFAGVVTLITATHPAMRSLASVTAIGMVSVVIVSFIVPPYVYRLLTEKGGRQRELPITFSRIFTSLYAIIYYVIFAFIISVISFFMRKETFHKLMQRVTRYTITHIPYVPFTLNNKSGETFEKPAVIVCNHQSMLDILAIMALHPKIIILTNEWVWNNPFWSRIVRKSNFFPITLGYDGVLPHLREVVAQGYSVMVFPEGTRTVSGEIGRFHPGAFRLAKDLGLDILPLMIHGFWHVLPKTAPLIRRGSLYMEICERINIENMSQEDDPSCLKIAKQFRNLYRTKYDNLRRERETVEYFIPYLRNKYALKCREVREAVYSDLRDTEALKKLCLTEPEGGAAYIDDGGVGVKGWIYALTHPQVEVYARIGEENNLKAALNTACIPQNLHFIS